MQAMTTLMDPVLHEFRSALAGLYGDRLRRVVLYGSRARGDANEASDYDIAVFLDPIENFNAEAARLAAIETELLFTTGAIINAMPLDAGTYAYLTPFMAELRRDGRDL